MRRVNAFRQRVLEREDRLWDEKLGLDTRGWLVPEHGTTVSGLADGFPYAGTHVRLARSMLSAVRANAAGATFVDLGAGKGRMLVLAAELPFAAVVGVEYSNELHALAERNLRRRDMERQRVRAELLDVRDFDFPETPLVIYLNNPFPEPVFEVVLANLTASYAAAPRPVSIVYQQLRNEDAEHDTRNVALASEQSLLVRRGMRVRGPVDRLLLNQYVLHRFESP